MGRYLVEASGGGGGGVGVLKVCFSEKFVFGV